MIKFHRWAFLLLSALAVRHADAAGPTAIMSSDSGHYRQAFESFQEAWGSSVTVISMDAPLPEKAHGLVVFGSKAAARDWPQNAVVVTCLAPSVVSSAGDAVTSVSLLPDPTTLLARLRAFLPHLKVLRVFWSSESSRADTEALLKAGDKGGVKILLERVVPPSRLPARLRELTGKTDALWLMPDPVLVNAENFAILREYAAAEKIPFLVSTEGMAERGATATIAVSFRDMGRAAARSLRARLQGQDEPELTRVGQVTVTVNAAAARSIGLGPTFDSADKILH